MSRAIQAPEYLEFGEGTLATDSQRQIYASIPVHDNPKGVTPKPRTARGLVSMSEKVVVVTADEKRPWKGRRPDRYKILSWTELEAALKLGESLLARLRRATVSP